MVEAFRNRLRKVKPARFKWAARRGLTAFRVYDRDIPEFRYQVDWYGGFVHVVEYQRDRGPDLRVDVLAAVADVLEVAPDRVFLKVKAPKVWGEEQYEKQAARGVTAVVEENGLKFRVNLSDYLDTGLFLDHRDTRARVRAEAAGRRVANLFCYTGSFTVYAAAGGAAATTSVDLSSTYLDWAADNLALNGLAGPNHELVRSDVLRWLHQTRERFDLVVLDPPSFSASKRMAATFEVQRDQVELLAAARALLRPGGVLWFSTNFRGFELDPAARAGFEGEELTPTSLPEDIRDRQVHRLWRLVRRG